MTDKQIIIDGVDVSGCSYHYKHTRVCLVKMDAAGRYYNCANCPDCDFKKLSQQLKTKEQECERWKSNFNGKVSAIEELLKQLDQLKGENEELKKTIMYKCPQCGEEYLSPIGASLYEENEKLKQTLTEIKEIAENAYCLTNGTNKDMANFAKQILQKISECEVKNEKL